VEHLCIGFNPGARVSGKILEVERAFGCISVGMGEYPYLTDGAIKNPSIKADQGMIENSGSFVTEELWPLERELRAASSRLLCHILSCERRMLLKEIQ
jgi:hypothetical protein